MSVAEFDTMTADEMVIHLFPKTADHTMTRLALVILEGTKPRVTALRPKVKETENSIWYRSCTNYGKLAQREQA